MHMFLIYANGFQELKRFFLDSKIGPELTELLLPVSGEHFAEYAKHISVTDEELKAQELKVGEEVENPKPKYDTKTAPTYGKRVDGPKLPLSF